MSPLDSHHTIALDMDGTLIPDRKTDQHNAERIELLRRWVVDNHKKHELYIVTFRQGVRVAELYPYGITTEMIKDVYDIPHRIWFGAMQLQKMGLKNSLSERMNEEYIHWKGKICKDIGATILVDDVPKNVIPGCTKYGIKFLDIKDFTYEPQHTK